MQSQEVAPSLKARFAAWIDGRTARGVKTYGTPLMTFNGRINHDALEEILDFSKYQEQDLMEAEALLQCLVAEGVMVRVDVGQAITAWLQKRKLDIG